MVNPIKARLNLVVFVMNSGWLFPPYLLLVLFLVEPEEI